MFNMRYIAWQIQKDPQNAATCVPFFWGDDVKDSNLLISVTHCLEVQGHQTLDILSLHWAYEI